MNKISLSITIIAYNEADRIEDCLKSVSFASEVIVILDKRTTDNTKEICQKFGAKVFEEDFINYGHQKNLAIKQSSNDWIFSIDSDERISDELKENILNALKNPKAHAFKINRKSFYLNKWILHGGWYPDLIVRLFNKKFAKFSEPEVHEEVLAASTAPLLDGTLIHYPFRSLEHQIQKNVTYAKQGAKSLYKKNKKFSYFLLVFKPISKFIECYFIKRGCLDGLAGFVIAINAAHSVFLKWSFLHYENRHH